MGSPVWLYTPRINSMDGYLGIAAGAMAGGSTPGSLAFPAANDALFVPFVLQAATLIKRLFSINGGTASGNIDVGVYSEDGTLISSAGSTAQAGTNDLQFFNVTDFILGPGRYYLAVAKNDTTGTLIRMNIPAIRCSVLGMAKQATAFPLPATATFATVTAAYLPLIGAEIRELL